MTNHDTNGDRTEIGSEPRRVFLVDDHPVLRDGLAMLVERMPRCMVCGEAASAAEALSAISSSSPDLVIMDLSLPDKNGLELIKDLRAILPDIRILAFSMHDEMCYAARCVKAGAMGYLMKGRDMTVLETAVNRVLDGGIYLSPQISDHLLRHLSGGKTPQTRLDTLSDRELEVFELIGRCLTLAQISERLNISPKTVDAHRANIKTKLNLPDAGSVMREAILWIELAKEPRTGTDLRDFS